jgi:hypothetical protein
VAGERKSEILFLYVGYFVTLALSLIPGLLLYAVIALALQLAYAITRWVGATEDVFRSHLYNYILGVGVSFAIYIVLAIQMQALGGGMLSGLLTSLFSSRSSSSFSYVIFIMGLEALFAVFWPIVLIFRGLYLINSGQPVYFGSRADASYAAPRQTVAADSRATTRRATSKWLASAILADGQVIKFELDGTARSRVIGRNSDEADIIVSDSTVGRRHARIDVSDGSLWISDLGSLNKTFVNDREIGLNPVQLRVGDRVQLGAVTLMISTI